MVIKQKKKLRALIQKARLKQKRIGTAVIIANVNGTKLGCAVSVVSPKVYNVIKGKP